MALPFSARYVSERKEQRVHEMIQSISYKVADEVRHTATKPGVMQVTQNAVLPCGVVRLLEVKEH